MVRGWGGGGRGPTRARGGAFTGVLATNGITISMDGKGAWRDNVFVERLWRSVKYEEVYLWAYESVSDARTSIGRYLDFYNGRRPHSSTRSVKEGPSSRAIGPQEPRHEAGGLDLSIRREEYGKKSAEPWSTCQNSCLTRLFGWQATSQSARWTMQPHLRVTIKPLGSL
jgi:Integrase core domain